MAERLTILCLGDLTATGTRPLSELTAAGASLDDVQADCDIWNIQAQAWQALQPGVNTDTFVSSSDKWSYESRLREALRTRISSGKIYVIKYSADSTLVNYGVKPCWDPKVPGSLFAGLLTQITNAAVAAFLAGGSLKIVGVLSSVMTEDWKQAFFGHEYFITYRTLIDNLRQKVAGIGNCSLGSLRNDSGLTPWVAIEPHYNWGSTLGFSTQQGVINEALQQGQRMRTQMVEQETDRIHVFRTHGLVTDNKGFATPTVLAMTDALVDLFYAPQQPDESALPNAEMVMLFGDSIAEGTSGNGDLPTFLSDPIASVDIWYPYQATASVGSASFQTLHAGYNNMMSLVSGGGFHGPELYIGSKMREHLGAIHLVKGSQPGALASGQFSPAPSEIAPTIDRLVNNWHPYLSGQLFDLMARGWLVSAIKAIRQSGKKPRARLVVISLGSNDILTGVATPEEAVNSIKSFIFNLKKVMADNWVDTILLKFSLAVPRSTTAGYFEATEETVEALRSKIQELVAWDPTISTVDLNTCDTLDGVHISPAGMDTWISQVVEAWLQEGSSQYRIQPLFMPSGTQLRAALRLSQVPDGNDGSALIDSAVEAAKVGFFRVLGPEKVAALQTIPYTTNPKSTQEILRVLAANTEVKWVRSQLLRTMPTLFMDSASPIQTWNDEAAFRQGSILQTRDELKRLQAEIDSALETLRTSSMSASGATISLVSPDSTIVPGQTVMDVF